MSKVAVDLNEGSAKNSPHYCDAYKFELEISCSHDNLNKTVTSFNLPILAKHLLSFMINYLLCIILLL